MSWMEWYDSLSKPGWTPSPGTISTIWMVLYPIIIVSFGVVFAKAFQGRLPRLVALPFALNLTANVLFMPIFSGLRNIELAAIDILVVWSTLLWCMVAIWPHIRWISLAQIPYFIWVSIATVLQLSITAMNTVRT